MKTLKRKNLASIILIGLILPMVHAAEPEPVKRFGFAISEEDIRNLNEYVERNPVPGIVESKCDIVAEQAMRKLLELEHPEKIVTCRENEWLFCLSVGRLDSPDSEGNDVYAGTYTFGGNYPNVDNYKVSMRKVGNACEVQSVTIGRN